MAGGKIVAVGLAAPVIARHPGAALKTYANHLIMAGFVDCHVHYPQIDIIASYGEQLIAWLDKYAFPAEAEFHDRSHTDQTALRAARAGEAPIAVGLATDVGGSSLSMFQTMKATRSPSSGATACIPPTRSILPPWAAPAGSGSASASATPPRAWMPTSSCSSCGRGRSLRSACEPPDSLWEALFMQMMLADDRAVRATLIAGQEADERPIAP